MVLQGPAEGDGPALDLDGAFPEKRLILGITLSQRHRRRGQRQDHQADNGDQGC